MFILLFSIFAISVITIGIAYIPENESVPRLKARHNTEYWQLERGFQIAYSKYSPESSENRHPIIFLHGGPGAYVHSSTMETISALANLGHEIYFYDQLGSGLSERPPNFRDASLPNHLKDLNEIVTKHIGAEKVILIGHSFGASVASHFLAGYPHLVSKIVFSSPGRLVPIMYTEEGIPERANTEIPNDLNFITPWRYQEESDRIFFKPKTFLAMAGALGFDSKLINDSDVDALLNKVFSTVTKGMVCDPNSVRPEEGGGGMYAYMSTNYNPDLQNIRPILKQLKVPSIILQGQCDTGHYGGVIEYSELLREISN